MKNRIEVDGVWYVKEESLAESNIEVTIRESDLTFTRDCVYEDDKYCFEFSVLENMELSVGEDGKFYMPSVTFTNKIPDGDIMIEGIWDNDEYLWGVYEGNPKHIAMSMGSLTPKGVNLFRCFLTHMVDVGYLIKPKNN